VILVLQRGEAKYQKAVLCDIQKDPDPEFGSGLTKENSPNPRNQ